MKAWQPRDAGARLAAKSWKHSSLSSKSRAAWEYLLQIDDRGMGEVYKVGPCFARRQMNRRIPQLLWPRRRAQSGSMFCYREANPEGALRSRGWRMMFPVDGEKMKYDALERMEDRALLAWRLMFDVSANEG